MAVMKKASPTPKPTARPKAGIAKPERKTKVIVKPSVTPTPKFTPPTLGEFKKSAAYKAGDWTYKQYVDYFQAQYNAKYKKK